MPDEKIPNGLFSYVHITHIRLFLALLISNKLLSKIRTSIKSNIQSSVVRKIRFIKIQLKGEIAEDSKIEWLSPTSSCKSNEANNSFSTKNTDGLVFTTAASYFCFSPSLVYLFVDTQTAEWCSLRSKIDYPGN